MKIPILIISCCHNYCCYVQYYLLFATYIALHTTIHIPEIVVYLTTVL